jgi:hypothetical protein
LANDTCIKVGEINPTEENQKQILEASKIHDIDLSTFDTKIFGLFMNIWAEKVTDPVT